MCTKSELTVLIICMCFAVVITILWFKKDRALWIALIIYYIIITIEALFLDFNCV